MTQAQFHPKKTLVPRFVVKGARMWSVVLEKTMVLEGELFFKLRDRIVCVKKGEVIAIPSNTPHEAFTKNSTVIAVDAWSPVMERYRPREKDSCALENERMLAGCIGMKS